MFAGNTEGGFEKGTKLTDKDGKDLKVGRATVVYVVDWEKDGDQDLVVGDIEGRVSLVRNGSGDKTFVVEKVERLAAGGKPIATPGRNSGPIVTDWNGDGRHDLVVGCGDGSVLLYRNTAEKGEPVFAAAETLIAKSNSYLGGGKVGTNPGGSRAKLALADWNGDGKVDLLVGDFASVQGEVPNLTEEQKTTRDELQARQKELQVEIRTVGQHFTPLYDGWYRKAREELGLETETPWKEYSQKVDAKTRGKIFERVRKYQQEDPKWPEYDKLIKENQKIYQELRPFQAPRSNHGFVWLYLRK